MQQIQARLLQLTQQKNRKAYESAITYLKTIIISLFNLKKQQKFYEQQQSIYDRVRSKSEGKQNIIQRYNSYDNIGQGSNNYQIEHYQQSEISFVQKINKAMKSLERQKIHKNVLNRRGLQQTIEIYHQCLDKSLKLIKKLSDNLFNDDKQHNFKRQMDLYNKNLQHFWGNYQKKKKQCHTFNDLIGVSHIILATQFLTVLNPIKKILATYKNSKKEKILVIIP